MIKKIVVIGLILLFIFVIYITIRLNLENHQLSPKVTPDPISSISTSIKDSLKSPIEKMSVLEFSNNNYHYYLQQINNLENLMLIPNFDDKLSTRTLSEKYKCKTFINGGFYDKKDRPLGLFFTNDKLLSKNIKSSLFDGYLIKNNNSIKISFKPENINNVDWIMQTGPILINEHQKLPLSIIDDKKSRRSIIAIDEDDVLYFVTIVGLDSTISGPMLADLPNITSILFEKEHINLESAINLDGGRASAFKAIDFNIDEITWTGSIICSQ